MKQIFTLLLLSFFVFTACQTEPSIGEGQKSDERPYVVTTTGMIKDAVVNISGGDLRVEALMGPGVDPHSYVPSQGDLRALKQADVIAYNGVHLEGKMQQMLEQLSESRSVYAMSEGIDHSKLRKLDKSINGGIYDPHIWFGPQIWSDGIRGLSEFLIKKYPENADKWRANTDKYLQEIDEMRQQGIEQLASIPRENRVLITSHDAFHYFGNAFDIEVRGLQGISTTSEFGLKDRSNLVDFIVDRNIKAVFVESSVSPKAIESVVESCRMKNHKVSIGGKLFSDAMGPEGQPGGTYIDMILQNIKTISLAL